MDLIFKIDQNETKLVVNFFVTIFVIVVLLTFLLLLIYYLTPNNYILEQQSSNKYNFIKDYMIIIEPNSKKIISISDSDNYLIGLKKINQNIMDEKTNSPISYSDTNELYLLIKNIFKSQGIIYTDDYMIRTKFGSHIIIPNQSDNNIKIIVSLWK